MTQKRIKAIKSEEYLDGKKPVKCYLIRQSDIRALAEQMHRDYWSPAADRTHFLYALKRAGMTPSRKERAK